MAETIGSILLVTAEAAGAEFTIAAFTSAGGWSTTVSSAAVFGSQTILGSLTVSGAVGTAAIHGASHKVSIHGDAKGSQ